MVTGLNLLKKGSDPPLKGDEELPDWLWKLGEPEKTLNELKRADEASLTLQEVSTRLLDGWVRAGLWARDV